MKLTADDHARIARAIAEAETRTSGEIFCVLAGRVSAYRDISLGWAAAAALILPLSLVPLGFDATWLPGFGSGWEVAHLAAREVTVGRTLSAYAMVQAAVFLAVFLLTSIPVVRRLVTPRAIRRARVRRVALSQFLAHGLHMTEGRTGVLIFAALSDHQVEVIADQGIHARVDRDVWAGAVEVLVRGLRSDRPVEGFEQAIGLCAQVLAEQFPPGSQNPNQIADRLVVI
ncbi:TPM domain-containing protein [uncultured Brevundimonas sp.]|uniref:TPM domain-containing protein n=1 Tax=uncultured Brevundimonas sp. TaxID=213418 RepID=UPI0030EB9A09